MKPGDFVRAIPGKERTLYADLNPGGIYQIHGTFNERTLLVLDTWHKSILATEEMLEPVYLCTGLNVYPINGHTPCVTLGKAYTIIEINPHSSTASIAIKNDKETYTWLENGSFVLPGDAILYFPKEKLRINHLVQLSKNRTLLVQSWPDNKGCTLSLNNEITTKTTRTHYTWDELQTLDKALQYVLQNVLSQRT